MKSSEKGFGKLSRLRLVTGGKFQLRSMELEDRNVIRIGVRNVPWLQEKGATTISGMRVPSPKKSSGWNVPGVIVTASFVEGD